jgi:hypothetical protein
LVIAARQGDGNDVALLVLKRIDVAHAESALQQSKIYPYECMDFFMANC